jgi:mannitol/fructose-specific phosphotransferase system IIA component (Ntr-type)
MKLSELLSVDLIKVGMQAEDREEAFEELVDLLVSKAGLSAREEILAAIRDRERQRSTGVRPGLAIPHGKTEAVERLHAVLGISRKGIDYESLDDKPVHVMFLLVTAKDSAGEHIQTLREIALIMQSRAFYEKLRAAKDAAAAYALVQEEEALLEA